MSQCSISSNNSFLTSFNTCDFPVPGPPCKHHLSGSPASFQCHPGSLGECHFSGHGSAINAPWPTVNPGHLPKFLYKRTLAHSQSRSSTQCLPNAPWTPGGMPYLGNASRDSGGMPFLGTWVLYKRTLAHSQSRSPTQCLPNATRDSLGNPISRDMGPLQTHPGSQSIPVTYPVRRFLGT